MREVRKGLYFVGLVLPYRYIGQTWQGARGSFYFMPKLSGDGHRVNSVLRITMDRYHSLLNHLFLSLGPDFMNSRATVKERIRIVSDGKTKKSV
jgi:hypothetical protein